MKYNNEMKKAKTNNMKRCPSDTDYQRYLNGSAEDNFIISFENHLKHCPLCAEAIEGYKATNLLFDANKLNFNLSVPNKEVRKLSLSKWSAYAAAIVILFSITFLFINRNHKINDQFAHADLQMNQNKKLMHKTTTEYWYVGDNETIAINDKLITPDDLSEAFTSAENATQVIVQIEDENKEVVDNIISSIKLNHQVPVYTFSKQKGLKVE